MGEVLISKNSTTPVIEPEEIALVGSGIDASEDGATLTIGVTNAAEITIGSPDTIVSIPGTMSGAIRSASVAFTLAELEALAGGVTHLEKTIELPDNARLISTTCEGVTPFEMDQTDTFGITIGTSTGGTQVATNLNVSYGQTGFPKAFTAGAQGYLMAPHSGATLYVRLTSADDLNLSVAGAATVNVFYAVI